jgi:hypothetical protein
MNPNFHFNNIFGIMQCRKTLFNIPILLIIIIFCAAAPATAQRLYSGFGVGGQMSTASYKDSTGLKKTTSSKYGIRAYWMGRVNLEGNIYFSPEVGYTLKGFKVASPESGIASQEITLHYFEIKLLQEYVFKDKFFLRIGPSISGALGGTNKTVSNTGLRATGKLPFNFDGWGRFEACINLGAGIHFNNGWSADLTLSDGLTNIFDGDGGPKVKNRLVGINISKLLR